MTIKILLMHTRRTFMICPFVMAMLMSLTLGGCTTVASSTDEKKVAFDSQKRAVERSTARWKTLTDKRFDESFSFLSEASRVGTNAGEYAVSMRRMGFVSAKVDSAACVDIVCTVKSTITLPIFVRSVGARVHTLPVEEQWIVNNGELWLIRR